MLDFAILSMFNRYFGRIHVNDFYHDMTHSSVSVLRHNDWYFRGIPTEKNIINDKIDSLRRDIKPNAINVLFSTDPGKGSLMLEYLAQEMEGDPEMVGFWHTYCIPRGIHQIIHWAKILVRMETVKKSVHLFDELHPESLPFFNLVADDLIKRADTTVIVIGSKMDKFVSEKNINYLDPQKYLKVDYERARAILHGLKVDEEELKILVDKGDLFDVDMYRTYLETNNLSFKRRVRCLNYLNK